MWPRPLSSDVSEIKLAFGIPPERPIPNVPPSWNVAPTDSLPIVRFDAKAGQRSLDLLRWGLVPSWAKDIKVGFANINARPRGSSASRLSARRSNAGVAWCRSTTFTNGRRPGPANSPTRSRLPIAASWRSRVYGKTGPTLSRRERAVMVEPRGTGMALFTLRSAAEVRTAQFARPEGDLDAEMVAIAGAIIKQRAGKFDPSTYQDRYQEALRELIEAKMRGKSSGQEKCPPRRP